MTALLVRIFVKNSANIKNPTVRHAYGTLVSVVCILLNLVLVALKLLAGALSGSIAMRADAFNNLSDAGSSVISLVSFRIAAKPADRDHPFGHARIEYVASMIVAFFILFMGVELVKGSIQKLISPVGVQFHLLAAVLLGVSILFKLWMGLFNRTVGKRINSDVMLATATDSLSDAGATAAVLLANLSTLFLPAHISAYVDPVVSLAVSGLIFFAGMRVLNDTKNSILGEAPSEATVAAILRMVDEYPDALGIHDLVIHHYGPGKILASLHVEVDGKKDIFSSHDTVDLIERRLLEEEGIECTVHLDPIITDDETINEWRARAESFAAAIDNRIQLHDFRMVPGLTHTNLIFDIAVPFEITLTDRELKERLSAEITATDSTFFAVITVDRS